MENGYDCLLLHPNELMTVPLGSDFTMAHESSMLDMDEFLCI